MTAIHNYCDLFENEQSALETSKANKFN